MMKNSPLRIYISLVFSVFLGLIAQAQPLITASFVTPGDSEVMAEDCNGPYQLIINRAPGNTDTTIITVGSSGEAILGVDFSFPPGTFPITLLPGQNQVIINITIVDDGVPEGGAPGFEEVTLELNYTDGTNSGILIIGSAIVDAYEIHLNISGDTIETCEYGIFVQFIEFGTSWESTGIAFWAPPTVTATGWHYIQVGNDTCGAKDSVYVELLYGNILEDTLYVCDDGPGVQINTQVTGDPIAFQWIPSDSTLSDTNILTPTAKPDITTTYILEVVFAECTSRDTVVVRVDSLPDDLHIDIAPAKPYYCAGEIVALFSPSFDSLAYPDLTFLWRPNDGTFLTDVTLLNAALQLEDTTLYIRDNINNACLSHDSIMINVVPAGVPLTVTDTTLCPGEMFEVTVLSNQVTEPEWTPTDGLSCSTCLSPTVTVVGEPGTTFVYNFSGKILECPVGASLSIEIPPLQEIGISGDEIVCNGDLVPLTISNPAGLSDFSWDIQSGNASLSCTNCLSPTVTINGNETVTVVLTANTTNPDFCGAIGIIQLRHGVDATIDGAPISACEGGTAIAFPGAAIENVVWQIESGDLSLSCTACPNPTVTIDSDGELSYTGTSTSPDTCTVSGKIQVTVDSSDIELTEIRLCIDQSTTISTGLTNIGSITWTRISGDLTLSCTNCPEPVVTLNGAGGPIQFSGFITQPDTCSFQGEIDITAETGADMVVWNIVEPDSGAIHQGTQVMLMLQTSGAPPTNIMWNVNGVAVGGNTSTITFNANQEVNVVIATFTNTFGCLQTAIDTIFALPPMYQIPNAFTPNGDMLNDKFRIIVNGNIIIQEFLVFNRWGQLVYEAPEDDLAGWDGRFKGEAASSDTYVYTATLQFPDRVEVVKGDVMLIR